MLLSYDLVELIVRLNFHLPDLRPACLFYEFILARFVRLTLYLEECLHLIYQMSLQRGINLRALAEKMGQCSGAEVRGICTEAGM